MRFLFASYFEAYSGVVFHGFESGSCELERRFGQTARTLVKFIKVKSVKAQLATSTFDRQ